MKRSFAVALVILIVLLLLLRKETKPAASKTENPPADLYDPQPAALFSPTPSSSPSRVDTAPTAVDPIAKAFTPAPKKTLSEMRAAAQTSLISSFTAQKAIFAEWDRYSTDLVFLGWEPFEDEVGFKMGFLSPLNEAPLEAGDQHEDSMRLSTDAYMTRGGHFHYSDAADKIRLSSYSRSCEHACTADREQFEILLAMPIDDQGHVDVWTINEKKEMKLVEDGTASR